MGEGEGGTERGRDTENAGITLDSLTLIRSPMPLVLQSLYLSTLILTALERSLQRNC